MFIAMNRLSNTKILVVDDDVFTRYQLQDEFASYDASVRTAANLDEALDLLNTSQFDVILFDARARIDPKRYLTPQVQLNPNKKPLLIIYSKLSDISLKNLSNPDVFRVFMKPCNTAGIVDSIAMSLNKEMRRAS